MKKIGKVKLNQFDKAELEQRKMNALKGGCACTYGGCSRSCPNPCECNDWLAGGINSANAYRYYDNLGNGGSSAY